MPYPSTTLYPGLTTYPGETSLTAAFQGYFNGLQFGPGSDVQLTLIDGFRALPALRSGDMVIARRDGAFPAVSLLGERIFTVDLQVSVTKDPFEQVIGSIAAALQNIASPTAMLPFQFMAPGWVNPLQIMCRPTKVSLPVDVNYSVHYTTIPVEFTAPDPLIYDTVQQSNTVGLPSPTAGLTFPATFPATFGASVGGSMSVTNNGNYASAPVFTLIGPMTNPTVSLGTGEFMRLNITLKPSDTVVIDMAGRTVKLNGTASRFNTVSTGSSWFAIPPGVSTIGVASSDSAQVAGTFTVKFRSAWGWA